MVWEKTLESPLDCKEIQPVHSKGDQPSDFFGRNGANAETSVLLPLHVKSWLIGKDSDAGRGWGQEEKGMTEDEMAGWSYSLDGCESEWTPEVGDGQGGLACCNSWGHKESDMTEWMNWTELNMSLLLEAPHVVLMVKNPPANVRHKRHRFNPWDRKILWWRAWQPTPIFLPGESWLPWAEEPGRLWFIGLYDWSN